MISHLLPYRARSTRLASTPHKYLLAARAELGVGLQ
jgi:hypothetical protein